MEISRQFNYGQIKVSNLNKIDELHFSFDITIINESTNLFYNFSESLSFSLFDFLEQKISKLIDENYIENYLELTKESLVLNINQDGFYLKSMLNFNIWEDQELLKDFLLEWKAYCEVLMKK